MVAASLATFAIGCGSDNGTGARRAVVDAAIHTQTSGPLQLVERAWIYPDRGFLKYVGSGVVDAGRDSSRESVSMSAGAAAPSNLRDTAAVGSGELAVQGDRYYLSFPLLNATIGHHVRWIVADPADPATRAVGLGGAGDFSAFDPARPLDRLRAADNVLFAGESVAHGQRVRRYTMDVDLDRYAELVQPNVRRRLEPRIQRFKRALGTTRLPTTVWIDRGGRVTAFSHDLRRRGERVLTDVVSFAPARHPPVLPRRAMTVHAAMAAMRH